MRKDPKTLHSGVLFPGSDYGKKFTFSEVVDKVGNLPAGMTFNVAIIAEDETEKKFDSFSSAFGAAEEGETVGIGFKMNGKPAESYGFEKLSGSSVKLVSIILM